MVLQHSWLYAVVFSDSALLFKIIKAPKKRLHANLWSIAALNNNHTNHLRTRCSKLTVKEARIYQRMFLEIIFL